LSAADVGQAAWALMPDGDLVAGPRAVLAAVDAALGLRLPVFSMLLLLPAVPWAADTVYDSVARHRSRLPGGPACPAGTVPPALGGATRAEIARRLARDS